MCSISQSLVVNLLLLVGIKTTTPFAINNSAGIRNCASGRILIPLLSLAMSTRKTTDPYLDTISKAVSEAIGKPIDLKPSTGGGYSGGGGASTLAVIDAESETRYFIKSATNGYNMLKAEYLGVLEIAKTNTIRVPRPVAYGVYEAANLAFVVFEYLEFTGGGSQYELGQNLAKMHRSSISTQGFGFHVDNTIGTTPQPNMPWMDHWADFWDTHRLGHMLKLTDDVGLTEDKVNQLRQKTRELLSHNPAPSLIHGDLWGGNKGFCREQGGEIVPVIFDPATYYGDREADVALTYLFGGFNSDFYKGYENEWPLPVGHEKRSVIYNLYHILNHYVLFSGGYLSQARSMIEQIFRM